jgi:hypothetical protein
MIRLKFWQPEVETRFGKARKFAWRSRVTMPEAAVHKDNLASFLEY